MEPVPWTVAAFEQRRRATWKAIRLWLVLLVIGAAGFSLPFYMERANVKVNSAGSRVRYHLSLDDMTGSELLISLVSFVMAGIGVAGTVFGTQQHYRCPRCEAMPMGFWTTFGPASVGWHSGVTIFPSVCRNCGAKLR
jgi:hypothetical protein